MMLSPDYHNFDKVVAIYNDPICPLTKILGYDQSLEIPSTFNDIRQWTKTHPFIEEHQYQ